MNTFASRSPLSAASRSRIQLFLYLLGYIHSIAKTPSFASAIASIERLDPQWLELLRLRFEHGYNDRAIARKLGVSERTIRNYWGKIQDALFIEDDPDKDIRVQIELKAKEIGLID